MSLAASTTVIARASAVDGRRSAPINATNDASTGRGDVSPSRLVLIFVRSYNQCMLHSTGSGALTHVNVCARVGHHAGSVDIVQSQRLRILVIAGAVPHSDRRFKRLSPR